MKKVIFKILLVIVTFSSLITSLFVGFNSLSYINNQVDFQKQEIFNQISLKMTLLNNINIIMQKQIIDKGKLNIINLSAELLNDGVNSVRSVDRMKEIAEKYGFDHLYLINSKGIVINTSFTPDMNLNLMSFNQSFTDYLKQIYSKGEVYTQRISQSTQTGKPNIYQYYSPKGSDFIVETSIDIERFVKETYGMNYRDDIVSTLFDKSVKTKNYLIYIDIFTGGPGQFVSLISEDRFKSFDGNDGDFIKNLTNRPDEDLLIKKDNIYRFYKYIEFESDLFVTTEPLFCEVHYDFSSIKNYTNKVFGIIIAFNICIVVLLILFGFKIFDTYLIKRIDVINYAINKIKSGEYDVTIDFKEKDELYNIGCNITKMAESIMNKNRELVEIKNHLDHLINSMPSIIITTDTEFRVKNYNKSILKNYGYKHKELTNRSLFDVIEDLSFYQNDIKLQILTGKKDHLKYYKQQIAIRGEHVFDILIYSYREGDAQLIVFKMEDITLFEKHREELERAQQIEIVGTISAGLAHDFNNALTGIMGLTELIKESVDKTAENDENFRSLLDLITHAKGTLSQLGNLKRQSEIMTEMLDLRSVVEFAYNISKSFITKRINIKTYVPDHPVYIMGNSTQLQQTLLNLMINGAHAMTIMRSSSENDMYQLIVSLSDDEGCVLLTVEDTGVGIAQENLRKMFDPFFTTKQNSGGSGLGLVMVKSIVENHKGKIVVESELNKGTKFIIKLPKYH